ncbi:MAG: sodium:proton antiporter, partial [Eubacterium sp.]|nr:sodium:proton antiporter [Eubacterium sp.]
MSFTSYTWVAQTEKKDALRAADTYLAVAVTGGLAMLMGLFLLSHMYGTLDFVSLQQMTAGEAKTPMLYAAGVCILVGFGAKAGVFPLHIWLPKAHPVAPAPASALLSGILTKTGIFGVIVLSVRIFGGDQPWGVLLALLGCATMFVGAVLGVFALDLKGTLACSSVSQIGFIVTGVAMCSLLYQEHALAAHGTLLHMMNHSLIKLVLFLSAGVVYMNTHELDLNVIRGFGRKKPLLAVCFAIGGLSIGGIPLFSGYISKTLLHESILELGMEQLAKPVEMIFIASGGLTIAYMTKLFVTVFIEKNEDVVRQQTYDNKTNYMSKLTATAISVVAVLLAVWGFCPHRLMERAAVAGESFFAIEHRASHEVHYFHPENLKGALYSLLIGAVVYFFVIRVWMMKKEQGSRVFVNRWPKWLDMENSIYRPLLLRFLPFVCGVICRVFDSAVDVLVVVLRKTLYRDTPLPHHYTEGNAFTRALGKVMNKCRDFANHTWRRSNPIQKDYVHYLAIRNDEIKQSNMIITRSVSFGLLLFGVGFCLMLFYVIAGDLK